jgi:hypothetical protein
MERLTSELKLIISNNYKILLKYQRIQMKDSLIADEIICDFFGGRNKKALVDYVENTDVFIAINTGN